jgi:hypothetical protein
VEQMSIEVFSDFGAADVDAVARGHDPARTRVTTEGDWLRIDLGRPGGDGRPGGIAQTIYLHRRDRAVAEGPRARRPPSELREELRRLLVDELASADGNSADARPDPRLASSPDAERRKRRGGAPASPAGG